MEVERILIDQSIEYDDLGKRFMVICPFHDDTNPSGAIWADSGYFRCFACGATANLAEYLSEELGITYAEARRITRSDESVADMEQKIRNYLKGDEDAFRYFSIQSFHETYPPVEKGSAEYEYVRRRGIRPSMIRFFDMRSGVHKYRHRVVLPIYTPTGRLVSYAGRAIKPGMQPKTRKSRSPHRTLFGIRQVVRKYADQPLLPIVVVEGEFDAIYLQQFGIAAVANMGTARMGPEKIRILRKMASKVVLSYDGDEAGQRALYGDERKEGQLAELSRYIPTTTVQLPEGVDPNNLNAEQVEDYYGEYRIG